MSLKAQPMWAGAQHRNSFDLIRLAAAFFVFMGHQLTLTGRVEPSVFAGRIALSSLGLYIFFALSGYLIARSLMRDSHPLRFSVSRALRIYPAYIVNLTLVVLASALVSSLPWQEFFAHDQTVRYIQFNTLIFTPPTQFSLPGVFTDTIWPVVNGSIWTIKYELLCYLILYLLLFFKPQSFQWKHILGACLLATVVYHWDYLRTRPLPSADVFFAEYNAFNTSRFLLTFLAGALYAACEPMSERARLVMFASLATLVTLAPTSETTKVFVLLTLTIIVVELGRSTMLYSSWYSRRGDYSYGFFLYSYPIQNATWTYFGATLGFYLSTLLSLFLISACAAISWHLIELPFLNLKPRRSNLTNGRETQG